MSTTKTPTLTGDPNAHPISEFSTGLSGTCLCGSISVTIHDDELFTKPRGHLCHCSNCRKVSGSFVSSNMIIEQSKVEIKDEKGVMKTYEDWDTARGNCVVRYFCSICGSPILSAPTIFPDKYVVKMGMFPRIPKPEFESFALHRHEWQGKHEGLQQFELLFGGKKMEE